MSTTTTPTECVLLGDSGNGVSALAFPRAALSEVRPHLRGAGIYILLGGSGCPDAYVGKAKNLRGRFRQHDTNKRRDYWDRGLVFRLTPPAPSKPKLAWLEEQVHALVAPNGQRPLRVRNRAHFPASTPLSGEDLDDVRLLLRDVEAMLGVLGFVVGATPATDWFSVTRAERAE